MTGIFNAIVDFFKDFGSKFGEDNVIIYSLALVALILIVALVVSYFSIEAVTNRKVKQINRYLLNNPFVTDENIVEFNRIMKTRMPRSMRYQWQKFMVNRNDKPSTYLSEDNCITKPFRNSMFVQVLKQVKYIVSIVAVLAFALTLGALQGSSLSLTEIILRASLVPMLLAVITFIFLSLMYAKRNSLLNEVIYNFDEMQHSLDRAVTTFPPFVDYEILFTRKEIVAGIPVLQEYLQQRAEYEQEELEKARLSQVEHEKYDFSKLGIKGNLIMDRAMKECEFYLGNRKILLADIDSIQNQKDLITSSYEDKNRNNQRKLRDIKETIDRLKEKLNTTTNKIVGNDIIRQQADEVKKQQLVEKEMEEDSNRYNQDIQKLDDQIAKKRKEIEDNRKLVETTLINDFKDYSDKIYDELKKIADSHVLDEIQKLKADNENLEHELEDRKQYIIQKNALYEEKVKENDSYKDMKLVVEQLKKDIIVKDQEIIGANKENESRAKENKMLRAELERVKKDKYHEVYRYFDMDGVEFFYDDKGEPYYFDNEGKVTYYQDAEKIKQLKTYKHHDDDGSAVLTEDQSASSDEQLVQPEVKEAQSQAETPKQETEDLGLNSEELESLNTVDEPEVEAETSTEEAQTIEPELEQNSQPEESEKEEPKAEESLETEQTDKQENTEEKAEPNEQYYILQPVNADEQTADEQEKQINTQIEEQNKILEQHHEELREQISQAVKAIEAYKDEVSASKEDKPKKAKKSASKKPAQKKKTTTKKAVTKKTASKKSPDKKTTKKAETANTPKKAEQKVKPNMDEKKTKTSSNKPKSKKGFVFKVKKAQKGVELEGFDLSGFNELFGQDIAPQKPEDKSTNGDKQ